MDGICGTDRRATVKRVASPGPWSCWKLNRRVIVLLSTFAKSIHSEHTLNKQVYLEGNVLVLLYAENELAVPTPACILKFLCYLRNCKFSL